MNKTAKRVLLLVAVVCMMFALFTAVAEVATECDHNWEQVSVLKAGTCKENGVYKDECTKCDAYRYVSRLGHNYLVSYIEATCIAPQKIGEVCSVCGVANPDVTPTVVQGSKPLEHAYESVYVAADCETAAGTAKVCVRCNGKLEGGKIEFVAFEATNPLYQPALGHEYVDKSVAPTCKTAGVKGALVCNLCGKEIKGEVDPIVPTNHKYAITSILVAGECKTANSGVANMACEYCGDKLTNVAFTPKHTLTENVVQVGNCGKADIRKVACSVCTYAEEIITAATGKHDYKSVQLSADCENPARVGKMCVVCEAGKTELTEVPGSVALGHNYTKVEVIGKNNCYYDEGTIVEYCARCNKPSVAKKEEADSLHTWKTVPAIANTCKTPGLTEKIYCEHCGKVKKEATVVKADPKLPQAAHEDVGVTILKAIDCATKTNGVGKYVCNACGADFGYQTIEWKHTWVVTKTIKAATCAEDGIVDRYCAVCNEIELGATISKTTVKHTVKDVVLDATCQSVAMVGKMCVVCKGEQQLVPVENSKVLDCNYEDAYYLAKGNCYYPAGTLVKICSMCGEPDADTADAAYDVPKHTEVAVADVPATCVSTGWKNKTICSACGEIVKKGEIDTAAKHDLAIVYLKAADCSKKSAEGNGTGRYECQLCDYVGEYTTILWSEAHVWTETVTKPATCIAAGEMVRACSVCGEGKDTKVAVPATGKHDYQDVLLDADCLNPAKFGKMCVICKLGEKDLSVVAGSKPVGHKWGKEVIYAEDTCYYPAGIVLTCSVCKLDDVHPFDDTIVYEEWKKLDHHVSEDVKAVEPTCKTPGWSGKKVCAVCGKVLDPGAEVKPVATNHDYELVATLKEASCKNTDNGIGKYECKECAAIKYDAISYEKAHNWVETIIEAATCGKDGKMTKVCTICNAGINAETGKPVEQAIAKTGKHTYATVTLEADCLNPALTGKICSVCQEGKYKEVNGEKVLAMEPVTGSKPLGHAYVETVILEANCDYPAGVLQSCSRCNAKIMNGFDNTVIDLTTYNGHKSKAVADIPADCKNEGWTGKTECSVCGKVLTEGKKTPVDATKHKLVIVEVLKEADCVTGKEGIGREECSICGKESAYRAITVAEAHDYELISTVAATCAKDGKEVYECSLCGGEYTKVLSKADVKHQFAEIYVEADCVKPAMYGKACKVCHTPEDANKPLVAVKDSKPLGHDDIVVLHAVKDCEYGKCILLYCQREGCELYQKARPELIAGDPTSSIEGTGHTVIDKNIVATCHTKGTTGRLFCTVCEKIVDEGTASIGYNPANHEWELDEVIIEATCTKAGSARYVCKHGCLNAEKVEAYEVKHTFGEDKADASGLRVYKECSVCGLVKIVANFSGEACTEHKFVEIKGYAATEEADGLTAGKKCDKCGLILYGCQKIPMIVCDHVNTEVLEGKAATCTEKGLTEGKKCNDCGLTLVEQEEIPALAEGGHTEVVLEAKAATCKETGLTEGKKCSVCEAIIVAQEEVEKLAHTEVVIEAKAATCTEAGLTEGKKCSVCEEIIVAQEEVKALGHTEVVLEAKAATCTEAGLTEGKKCSVCEVVLVEQEEVKALGHTEVVLEGKAATCDAAGLTEGKKCSVCEEIIVAQEEIEALGHKYAVSWDFNADFTKKLKIFTCEVCGDTYSEEVDF